MQIYLSLLVCLVGLVLYLITNRPTTPPPSDLNVKCNVLGLHMFWVGLLTFLLRYAASSSVSFLK